jgi:hypothetical protein
LIECEDQPICRRDFGAECRPPGSGWFLFWRPWLTPMGYENDAPSALGEGKRGQQSGAEGAFFPVA